MPAAMKFSRWNYTEIFCGGLLLVLALAGARAAFRWWDGGTYSDGFSRGQAWSNEFWSVYNECLRQGQPALQAELRKNPAREDLYRDILGRACGSSAVEQADQKYSPP